MHFFLYIWAYQSPKQPVLRDGKTLQARCGVKNEVPKFFGLVGILPINLTLTPLYDNPIPHCNGSEQQQHWRYS